MEAKARKVRSSLDTGPSIGLGTVQRKHKARDTAGEEGDAEEGEAMAGILPVCRFIFLFPFNVPCLTSHGA